VRHDCVDEPQGQCWDNAPSERFFNSLKNERVDLHGLVMPASNLCALFMCQSTLWSTTLARALLQDGSDPVAAGGSCAAWGMVNNIGAQKMPGAMAM